MPESEWAKRMAEEFKAVKARKDAQPVEEQRTRKEAAYKLWTHVRQAFKDKTQMFNAAVGEQILGWDDACINPFSLLRKGIEGCVRGSYHEAGCKINIEVVGRLVPFEVVLEQRTGKYCLVGAAGKPCEPEELAETLIGEFLTKY
jgi:hypothetical protein